MRWDTSSPVSVLILSSLTTEKFLLSRGKFDRCSALQPLMESLVLDSGGPIVFRRLCKSGITRKRSIRESPERTRGAEAKGNRRSE